MKCKHCKQELASVFVSGPVCRCDQEKQAVERKETVVDTKTLKVTKTELEPT